MHGILQQASLEKALSKNREVGGKGKGNGRVMGVKKAMLYTGQSGVLIPSMKAAHL